MSEPIAIVRTSVARWVVGIAVQAVLGILLIWVAVVQPPASTGWLIFLYAAAAVAFWGAYSTWGGGMRWLELTEEVLRDSSGAELCRIDQVAKVDRSVFAFKPARGFLLVLDTPGPRAWVPGLWWRLGRRVGVGGTTSSAQTRFMAETIQAMIQSRQS
jgi:hypothetical protein